MVAHFYLPIDISEGYADGQAFEGITIVSLPSGSLHLNLLEVNQGEVIAAADIANLIYTPFAGASVRGDSDTFQYSVSDGTANSDVYTLTLNIQPLALSSTATTDYFISPERTYTSTEGDDMRDDSSTFTGSHLYNTLGGDDAVTGTSFGDVFNLGLGDDTATGGRTDDIFIQQVGLGVNSLTVTDFQFGVDVLTLVDSAANLLGDTFFDLTLGAGVVTAELLSDGTDITGLELNIGTDDTITLTFASASQFAVADIKATLGLADDVTLSHYFTDDAGRDGTQYVFTQTAFTEAIFDELLGDGGLETLQSAADTPYIV